MHTKYLQVNSDSRLLRNFTFDKNLLKIRKITESSTNPSLTPNPANIFQSQQ